MQLRFTKMHGLGNDFVVFDAMHQDVELSREQYRFIADRHFGIGCDQILLIEHPRSTDCDFYYRIFNADGGEVQQCGNGARCLARYVREKGLSDQLQIRVETLGGRITLTQEANGLVTVDMGKPVLEPRHIPFNRAQRAVSYPLDVAGEQLEIAAVSMGNPHAVLRVADVESAPVARLGPMIENHPDFPERVNAGFIQILDTGSIRLRVYERGAGETLACGTGACAAVVAGRLQGLLDENVSVQLPGGRLVIQWRGEGHPVMMSGPAEAVFEGSIEL